MEKAEEQKIIQEVAQITERLELKKADVALDGNRGNVPIDEYIKQVENNEDMLYKVTEVQRVDEENAYITVEEKYEFLLEQEENGNLKITYQGEIKNSAPRIANVKVETAEHTIDVKATAIRAEKYIFYIKENETSEYVKKAESENEEYVFSGLGEGKEYFIKVEAINVNGQDEREVSAVTVDITSPTCVISTLPTANPTNASSITYIFEFSENVIGFTKEDIIVANGIKGEFSGSNNKFELVVTNSQSCTQTVSIAAGVCTDKAGNKNIKSEEIVVIDRVSPVLSSINVTSPKSGTYKEGQNITIVSAYSEKIYGNNSKSVITSANAPILKIKFGNGEEKAATFVNVSEDNKIIYTYTITNGDNGKLTLVNYVGTIYDQVGNSLIVTNKTLG